MQTLFENITHIIFDLDGLLIDSEPLWKIAEERALAAYGKPWQREIVKNYIGLRIDEVAGGMVRDYQLPVDAKTFGEELYQHMFALVETDLTPMPGANEVIHGLKAVGLPLAIASSSITPFIEKAVDHLGWRDFIRTIASGAEVPRGKPAPDVYLLAAERLQAAPQTCLALEDSLNGARAAHAAGMRTVAVPGEDFTPSDFDGIAHAVFPRLSDILTFI